MTVAFRKLLRNKINCINLFYFFFYQPYRIGLQTNQTFSEQFVNRSAGSSFVSVCLLNKRTRTRTLVRLVKCRLVK
ncbi:hypothetical protein HanRHA438_Chr04g0153241 [Helianthus annuus]|nr:hypothetical protein HanRHA438_Chr04g0153241 [Helianthus annuus]